MLIKRKQEITTPAPSFVSRVFLVLFFLFVFISPVKASAATYYFSGSSDWADTNSWCDDSNCDSHANLVPGINDDVVLLTGISSNSGDPASVNSFSFDSTGSPSNIDIEITVANTSYIRNNNRLGSSGIINGPVCCLWG